MTAKEMSEKFMSVMDIKPGVYYLGQWMVLVPGGDVTISACRPMENPTDWYVALRFAQYVNDKPFNGLDKRFVLKTFKQGTEKDIEDYIGAVITAMPPPAQLMGKLEVRGGSEKYFEMIEDGKRPPWMHKKKVEEAG